MVRRRVSIGGMMNTTRARRWAVVFCAATLIMGCSLPRNPRVENDRYKNFEFEFMVKVPKGWTPQTSMPEQVSSGIAGRFADKLVCMLSNPGTQGTIVVEAETSDFDIVALGQNPTPVQEQLTEYLETREAQFTEEGDIVNYAAEPAIPDIAEGYGPTLFFTESAQGTLGDRVETAAYLNKCQKASTCMIRVILISKEDNFETNYEAFAQVANSTGKVYLD